MSSKSNLLFPPRNPREAMNCDFLVRAVLNVQHPLLDETRAAFVELSPKRHGQSKTYDCDALEVRKLQSAAIRKSGVLGK